MKFEMSKEDSNLVLTLLVRNIVFIYNDSIEGLIQEDDVAEFVRSNQLIDNIEQNGGPVEIGWDAYYEARDWYKVNYKTGGILS